MKKKLTWDDFSRVYTAEDITTNTIIVEVTTRGRACSPLAFTFFFIIPCAEAIPGFEDALASLSASDGEESLSDEITFLGSVTEFLAVPEHQAELLEDYNFAHEQRLPVDYQFKLGDASLIAAALNAHNSLQF